MRALWKWTKRIFFMVVSALLFYGGVQRMYYFHDEMVYKTPKKLLNPSYEDQVEVETYLMSEQNVIDLLEGNPPAPDRTVINERWYYDPTPRDPRFYLVVRLKNKGDRIVWGTLDCFSNGVKRRQIDVPPLPAKMGEFANIIVFSWHNPKGEYPELSASWVRLYTQKKDSQ